MSPAKLYIEAEHGFVHWRKKASAVSFTIQQYENQGTDSLPVSNDLSVHSYESTIHWHGYTWSQSR